MISQLISLNITTRTPPLSTVSDSSWYQLYFRWNPLNPLISYMSSPTYRIEYDSVTLNGLECHINAELYTRTLIHLLLIIYLFINIL